MTAILPGFLTRMDGKVWVGDHLPGKKPHKQLPNRRNPAFEIKLSQLLLASVTFRLQTQAIFKYICVSQLLIDAMAAFPKLEALIAFPPSPETWEAIIFELRSTPNKNELAEKINLLLPALDLWPTAMRVWRNSFCENDGLDAMRASVAKIVEHLDLAAIVSASFGVGLMPQFFEIQSISVMPGINRIAIAGWDGDSIHLFQCDTSNKSIIFHEQWFPKKEDSGALYCGHLCYLEGGERLLVSFCRVENGGDGEATICIFQGERRLFEISSPAYRTPGEEEFNLAVVCYDKASDFLFVWFEPGKEVHVIDGSTYQTVAKWPWEKLFMMHALQGQRLLIGDDFGKLGVVDFMTGQMVEDEIDTGLRYPAFASLFLPEAKCYVSVHPYFAAQEDKEFAVPPHWGGIFLVDTAAERYGRIKEIAAFEADPFGALTGLGVIRLHALEGSFLVVVAENFSQTFSQPDQDCCNIRVWHQGRLCSTLNFREGQGPYKFPMRINASDEDGRIFFASGTSVYQWIWRDANDTPTVVG